MRTWREDKNGDFQHSVPTDFSSDKGNTFTKLLREVQLGNCDQISKSITATLVTKTDSLGWTLLHHAAFLGRVRVSKILLSGYANVNAQDLSGYTPLHLSSSKNNMKLSWLLIKYGARTDLRDRYGRTPAQMTQSDTLLKEFKLWNRLCQRRLYPLRGYQRDFSISDVTKRDDFYFGGEFASPIRGSCDYRPNFVVRDQRLYDEKPAVKVRLWKNARHAVPEPIILSPIILKNPNNSVADHQQKRQWAILKLLWVKTKRIAKWQMMTVAVRLLLCYLLELVVDHTKHILYSLVLNYSLLDLLHIVYSPSREFLYPLYSFFKPVLSPIYSLVNIVLNPFYQVLHPFFSFVQHMLRPIVNLYTASLKFMILRLQWMIVPAYRYLVEPFLHMVVNFIKWLYTASVPVLNIFSELLANIYYFLNLITLYILHPTWQALSLLASVPWKTFQSKVYGPLAQIFKSCIKKLLEKTLNSIQPMLNIQGFFSKVFGPLVSGLKAILHWLLPNWLIRPIEYLSSLIFGEIHSSNIKQNYSHSSHSECNSHLQTEETALTVIFVFIAVIYGSILGLGYVFKIIYGISVFLNLPYHSQLRRLVTNAVLDDRPLEPTQVESSTSLWQETLYCLSPDWTHHQLGILMLVLSLFLIIMFKLTRCVFRLSRKFLRLFVTVCIPKSVKHFSIMPTKRTKHKIPPIKPSSANSSSLPNPGNPPVRSRTTSFVKLATLSFLSPPNIKNDMSISKDSVSPTVLSLTSSITGAHRVQRSNTFTAPSSSDATRLPQHNVETRKTNGHFTIKYHPL